MNVKAKKELFEENKRIYESALLTFYGVEGFDVYNCSLPFTGVDGKRYIYGRVERPDEWANSVVRLFAETGKDTYALVENSMVYQLEDPFLQRIGGMLILGGTHVRKKRGGIDTYYGYFYRGDETRMTYFTTGPDRMKDIRLIELPNGKIGLFSRPRNGTYTGGAKAQIGYTVIDSLDELDAEVIDTAPYLADVIGAGEWGGVNQAYLLKSGKIGVIGHMSYDDHTADGQHLQVYVNTAFTVDPISRTASAVEIIGTKSCYPACAPKIPRLADCVFTTGILPREDGKVDLYSGVGDTAEGRIVIDDPFEKEGGVICSL
ncbi:MAG: DUF1861 family protein [Eubacteriales bacterium]